jgi:hypothetical protein
MNQVKERPILFSAPMVRAILDGRKTVTRRPVKGSALKWLEEFASEFVALSANELCPFGQIGERLWVRETWYCDHFEVQKGPYLQPADMHDLDQSREDGELVYAADGLAPYEQEQPTWKPSIHMPRWASRILLEITDVRVERLQDISREQCIAEGPDFPVADHLARAWHVQFERLWNSTGGDWDANPWVWVVEFKRVTP